MIILDYQDRRPIYEQITERFRTLIYQGALPAGSRLPSVRQLAMELSINPNTIQRAYMTLEQEGLIYPVRGKGEFCCGDHTDTGKEQGRFSKGISGIGKKGNTDGNHGRRDAFDGSEEL